jgi:tRNA threonylcarbamoyladenosine biosynthesis protein TsaE
MQVIEYHIQNITKVANEIWQIGKPFAVWCLNGDMGAGKTTFISALCDTLGIQDMVNSPTFAIINEYEVKNNPDLIRVFHADWYRLNTLDDAISAGIDDIMYQPKTLTLIEWGVNIPVLFHKTYLELNLEMIDAETRRLTIQEIKK